MDKADIVFEKLAKQFTKLTDEEKDWYFNRVFMPRYRKAYKKQTGEELPTKIDDNTKSRLLKYLQKQGE
jgi:hypothetical protein